MNPTFVDPQRVLAKAYAVENQPYIFGRKGPLAFDCSGLITWAIKAAGGPDWTAWRNAHLLWTQHLPELRFRGLELETAARAEPGEILIACYGHPTGGDEAHCDHVMLTVGDGRCYGACGGDHTTLTLEDAKRRDAKVRFRPRVSYLPTLLGYRRLAYARASTPAPGAPSAA